VADNTSKTDGRTSATSAPKPGFRIVTAPMPKEIVPRGMLAPSMIAHLLAMKDSSLRRD
jgi:hypothetical protein